METSKLSLPRDCAACVFSFCLNDLREPSAMSIESNKVSVQGDALNERLCY